MKQSKLQELSERLTRWRKANRPRTRLPEEFWREAVGVARQEGLYRTAKALPVDWRQLKKWMKEPEFVEIQATAAARGPALELETRQGRVRLELGGMGAEEIARLVKALGA